MKVDHVRAQAVLERKEERKLTGTTDLHWPAVHSDPVSTFTGFAEGGTSGDVDFVAARRQRPHGRIDDCEPSRFEGFPHVENAERASRRGGHHETISRS